MKTLNCEIGKKLNQKQLKTFSMLILGLCFLLSTSCMPNRLYSQDSLNSGLDNQSGQVAPTPGQNIDQVDMKSLVDDSQNKMGFNGMVAFDLDKTRGEFIVLIPLPSGFVFTPSGAFNKYPDITFSPVFDASGKMKLAVRVPVKYVLRGVNFIPAARLPNGDPLPAMPAGQGELPALAISFPQQNNTQISIYIGINALGAFITLPQSAALPLPVNITLPLKNRDKSRTFGYLTYVNAKNGYPPGLFVATGVPASFARILEDYFGVQ